MVHQIFFSDLYEHPPLSDMPFLSAINQQMDDIYEYRKAIPDEASPDL